MTCLVVYRNGSGYKTLRASDHRVTDNGHLKVIDEDGGQHLFSASSDWHLKTPGKEAVA